MVRRSGSFDVIHLSLLLVLTAQVPTPKADSLRTLSPDELTIYTLAIRAVNALLREAAGGTPIHLALDPYVRKDASYPLGPAVNGTHLSPVSLRAVADSAHLERLCEPLDNYTCRGSLRGMVLRLPEIRFYRPDSAEVTLLITPARAEVDNTWIAGDGGFRSYVFVLARRRGTWEFRSGGPEG